MTFRRKTNEKVLLFLLVSVMSIGLLIMWRNQESRSNYNDGFTSSEPDTIDPALNSSVTVRLYYSHFSGLVDMNKLKMEILELVVDIAKELPEVEETDDGKVKYVLS